MAETNFLAKPVGILSLLLRLIYRLTVKLTVEFLKIGTLLAILISASVASGLSFIYCIAWAYTTSGGSILIATCACVVVSTVFVAVFWLIQVLVKDVLCLTDLTLPELAKLFVTAALKKSKDKKAMDNGKAD
ncbi:hypothetical protein ElyMa_000113200 [Elysia marginata]|uniref:MARVEL domain-containing protein n=1 Tax=Elysia marginata TaxID=1093978 RepID=A0AAV4EMJ5_9GAST|nr:hypothetical protein ElyMa_000113200 [Elysia marginata]